MANLIKVIDTVSQVNRKDTGTNNAFGPLDTLAKGNTWVGDTGYNLMVVPSPLGPNGFIVIISQLFETHIFDAVPGPVPNRSLHNGTAQVGAVKYSQVVAEKASKNILHEETGMWLNQTLGRNRLADPTDPTMPVDQYGLGIINGELNGKPASELMSNPIVRSGTIPHGNTFQAAGKCTSYPNLKPKIFTDVSSYISLGNFPTAHHNQLNFLPTFVDGSDSTQLQEDYRLAILKALSLMKLPHDYNSVDAFINPIELLNKYANNITHIDSLAITTADDHGMVLNVPFAKAVAGPQNFICTFMIEEIDNMIGVDNKDKLSAETDQVASYFQIQYLQSIPLLFPKGYKGKDVLFPHWNVNTLIAI